MQVLWVNFVWYISVAKQDFRAVIHRVFGKLVLYMLILASQVINAKVQYNFIGNKIVPTFCSIITFSLGLNAAAFIT